MAGIASLTTELARLRARLAGLEPGVFAADDCVALADALFATERARRVRQAPRPGIRGRQ